MPQFTACERHISPQASCARHMLRARPFTLLIVVVVFTCKDTKEGLLTEAEVPPVLTRTYPPCSQLLTGPQPSRPYYPHVIAPINPPHYLTTVMQVVLLDYQSQPFPLITKIQASTTQHSTATGSHAPMASQESPSHFKRQCRSLR